MSKSTASWKMGGWVIVEQKADGELVATPELYETRRQARDIARYWNNHREEHDGHMRVVKARMTIEAI